MLPVKTCTNLENKGIPPKRGNAEFWKRPGRITRQPVRLSFAEIWLSIAHAEQHWARHITTWVRSDGESDRIHIGSGSRHQEHTISIYNALSKIPTARKPKLLFFPSIYYSSSKIFTVCVNYSGSLAVTSHRLIVPPCQTQPSKSPTGPVKKHLKLKAHRGMKQKTQISPKPWIPAFKTPTAVATMSSPTHPMTPCHHHLDQRDQRHRSPQSWPRCALVSFFLR